MALADFMDIGTYSRVEKVRYCKQSKEFRFFLIVYKPDQEEQIDRDGNPVMVDVLRPISAIDIAAADGINDHDKFDTNFSLDKMQLAENPVKAAYLYLKTMDGFKTLEDC